MKIAVCVKLIPDPAAPGSLDPTTNTLKRSGKFLLDEADSYGIEVALQLNEAAGGGEVTLVTMSPTDEGIQTGLAMGADKAVIITDAALHGTDALGTAKVLAAAIARIEPDLIIAATESTDGYTGTMPVQLAELLALPSVSFAKGLKIEANTLQVERQTERGYDEVTCALPALVTVTAGVVEPRYPNFKGIMAAKSKPRETLTLADLGIAADAVGFAGAHQKIVSVESAPTRNSGDIVVDEGNAHETIVSFLEQAKVL